MPFYVYIIYAEQYNRFYIGQTEDIEQRIDRHNRGYEKATSPFIPWEIKCVIEKPSRSEAMLLERKLKNLNRQKLLSFVAKYGEE